MSKAIITVVGKDTVGIIAKVCTYLAEHRINILDISQTIVQGYFNMMMIVDVSSMTRRQRSLKSWERESAFLLRSREKKSSQRCTESDKRKKGKEQTGYDKYL